MLPRDCARGIFEETSMRRVVLALGALVLATAVAEPAVAQTQPKPRPAYAKKAAPQYSAEGQPAAQPRSGYQEQLADKMRFGSSAWWEQMKREGRLGGETP
jgi:hypothetical protein